MTTTHEFSIGDYARGLETNWLGKILAFEVDHNGDTMARMVGVDELVTTAIGLPWDEALSSNDVRWYDPRDLVPVGK